MLRKLDAGLWVIDHPLRLAGTEFGTRTTVVQLSAGGLFVHSPGPLSDELRGELEAAGSVRALVAPNKVHHMFLAENARAFPNAEVHTAPGLRERFPGLPEGPELGDDPPELWSADLDQVWVRGAPRIEEVAFLHRASRTLLLADLAFNYRHVESTWTRLFLRVMGAYGRFGPSRLARSLLRDRAAVRAGIDRILEWDFDRVVVPHGDVLEAGGREALRAAYAWLR